MFPNESKQHKGNGTRTFSRGGRVALLFVVALLLAFAGTAGADVVTRTWIGGTGTWMTDTNWSPTGVPNNSATTKFEVVIDDANEGPSVPDGADIAINALTIDNGSGFVTIEDGGSLELEDSGGLDSQGTTTVIAGGTFILNGGTVTFKEIVLEGTTGTAKRAKLLLLGDTTFVGAATGPTITGTDPDNTSGTSWRGPTPQTPDGLIDGSGAWSVTLASGGKIHGELEIRARLTNNGIVDADDEEGKILLSTNTKSGAGGAHFKATAGLLEVDANVTGSADWTAEGTGFLYITVARQVSGTNLNVLKVGNDNAGLRVKGPVTLAGNLDVTTTCTFVPNEVSCIDIWWWNDPVTFTGGTFGNYVTIELAGQDVFVEGCNPNEGCNHPGNECWDAAWPFTAMGMGIKVIIGEGAHVKGVDGTDNGNRDGAHSNKEVFFVDTLHFEDTAGRYKKNDIHAHFCNTNAEEGQIED